MIDLFQQSKEIILENQSKTGAYVAGPTVPDYRYCWFRDGSFIAYAMDLVGEHGSAHAFHHWASSTVNRYEHIVEKAVNKAEKGERLTGTEILPARYTLDGKIKEDEWPNFQLDGYGTWLWALSEHAQRTNITDQPSFWEKAIRLVVMYLGGLWNLPNYDCWEENGDKIHPYTLGAIYAGLTAAANLVGGLRVEGAKKKIKETILQQGQADGYFTKHLNHHAIDASLIGLSTPYRVVPPTMPVMKKTAELIKNELRGNGGVHRYKYDTYYGGGEWLLLAAWLGWYATEVGREPLAKELLAWIQDQADGKGNLPEQVPVNLIEPSQLERWKEERGEIAKPLLWSHAKYLILYKHLVEGDGHGKQE